jgi:hypothetical protein
LLSEPRLATSKPSHLARIRARQPLGGIRQQDRFLSRKVARETIHALAMRGDGKVMTAAELDPWM